MTDVAAEWSTERIEKAFRDELAERFRAHNEAYRKIEEDELAAVLAKHPEKRGQPGYEVRDSFAKEFLDYCQIKVESNTVTIVMPVGFAFRTDLIPLFDHTAMAWSRPNIGAVIVDGVARPTIEITLVATWTDEMDAKWRADGHARKHVDVELYEDDVRWLLDFIDRHPPGLRERLELALLPIP
jgi:hypothetical protein